MLKHRFSLRSPLQSFLFWSFFHRPTPFILSFVIKQPCFLLNLTCLSSLPFAIVAVSAHSFA